VADKGPGPRERRRAHHYSLGMLLSGVLAAAGCSAAPAPGNIVDPGSAPSASASAAEGPKAPLTGGPADPALAVRSAVVVPVRVGAGSAAPAGLDTADMLFQEYAESGSVRLLSVYQSREAGRVGPVAEIRPADVKALPVLRPFVAYAGGPPSFVDQLNGSGMANVSVSQRADLFPGGFTATTSLYPAIPLGGTMPPSLFNYGGPRDPLAKTGVTAARQLAVTAPGHAAQVWTYDADSALWRSSLGGVPVAVATVAVLVTPYKTLTVKNPNPHDVPSAQVLGEGEAFAVSGSSAVKGRWSKPAPKMVSNVVDANNIPIRPQPGAVWFVYAPEGSQVTVQ
jgi:hypothetical protein